MPNSNKPAVKVPPSVTALQIKTLHMRIDKIAHVIRHNASAIGRLREPADVKLARKKVLAFDKRKRASEQRAYDAACMRINRVRADCLFKLDADASLRAVEALEQEARSLERRNA
jgi:hypothetical protein